MTVNKKHTRPLADRLPANPLTRGGYGRPAAAWLIHEELQKLEAYTLTYQEIANATGATAGAIQRLCRKYAKFLLLTHKPDEPKNNMVAHIKTKRLLLLHLLLSSELDLKMQMRRALDGRKHSLPGAFDRFLTAARCDGYQGGDKVEKVPMERNPDAIGRHWNEIKIELSLP
ncbi:MAG TPA: hypothetical protein VE954_06520 [Oligoflexus sp.]|uniref:hypothetical protein n=1 Tax=Oligoflexus sp. TaxID=1971216 RepID=UPI002D6278AE|nr:hypothetical protein [Oligoflexus sp.]HYX32750.1 hypothetical protein [Oligoflexus sp.]